MLEDRRGTLAVWIAASGWVVAAAIGLNGRGEAPPITSGLPAAAATAPAAPAVPVALRELTADEPARPPARPLPVARRSTAELTPAVAPPPEPEPATEEPSAPIPAAAALLVAQAVKPIPPDPPALVGVTQLGDGASAWLVDRRTRARRVAAVGESAFGYEVRSIQPESVTLSRDGVETVVRLGDFDLSPVEPAAAAPPRGTVPSPGGPTATSNGNVVNLTNVVVVPPPDEARSAAPASRREENSYPSRANIGAAPVIILNPSTRRGYNGGRYYRSPSAQSNPQTSRRLGGRVIQSVDGDALAPEPIANPQTLRRLAAADPQGFTGVGAASTWSPSRPRVRTNVWISTPRNR